MAKVLCSGSWQPPTLGGATTMVHIWSVGQIVIVRSRTWAGINRPGGHGKITKLHYAPDGQIASMDVKYTLSSCFDRNLEPHLVTPWQELDRAGRRQRGTGGGGTTNKNVAPKRDDSRDEDEVDKENKHVGEKHKKAAVPVTKPQRRPAVPKAFSFKKKKTTRETAKEQGSKNNNNDGIIRVPPMICVNNNDNDDACSIVSELEVGFGIEERPCRTSFLLRRDSGETDPRQQPRRRPTLETTTSHSNSRASPSPCSKAQSIASGQIVGTTTNEEEEPTMMTTSSPVTTKSLAVGKVQPAVLVTKNEEDPHQLQGQPQSNYVTLEQVYKSEKRRATEFVNQVVDHRDDDDEVMLDTEDNDAMSCTTTNCPRRNMFIMRLVYLLQEHDGVLDDDDTLLALINQHEPLYVPPFDSANLEEYLQFLCDENKIMRSNGQIYSI